MKKYVTLVLAAALTISMATVAQDQTPPPARKGERKEIKPIDKFQVSPEKRAEKMSKELGLTDAEKAKVQALFVKQAAARSKDKAEMEKLKKEHMAKFEAERKAQDAELEKIIGKEKFLKLEKERADMKAKLMEKHEDMQGHQIGRRMQMNKFKQNEYPQISAENRADKMAKTLGLSDTEKANVKEIFEKQSAKMEQFKSEVKKFREEKMAQFKAERKAMDADLEKAIGPDKYQKLEAKKSELIAKIKERHGDFQLNRHGREWELMKHKKEIGQMVTPEKRSERMAKELELTDAQKADVKSLFEQQDAMRHQQMEKAEKMKADMKAQFEAQRKTNEEALAKIIGQEKFQKLQAMHADKMAKMKDKMKEMKKRQNNNAPENNGDTK